MFALLSAQGWHCLSRAVILLCGTTASAEAQTLRADPDRWIRRGFLRAPVSGQRHRGLNSGRTVFVLEPRTAASNRTRGRRKKLGPLRRPAMSPRRSVPWRCALNTKSAAYPRPQQVSPRRVICATQTSRRRLAFWKTAPSSTGTVDAGYRGCSHPLIAQCW